MTGYHGRIVGPNGEHFTTTTVTPEQLAAARQAETERINRAVAARLEREAAHKAEQEQKAHEQGAAELEAYKEQARAALLSSGGTAADFDKSWPALKAEYLTEAARSRLTAFERTVEQTKAEMRASGRFPKF